MAFHQAETCTVSSHSTSINQSQPTGLESSTLTHMLQTMFFISMKVQILKSPRLLLEVLFRSTSSLEISLMLLLLLILVLLVDKLFHLFGLSDGNSADSVGKQMKTGTASSKTTRPSTYPSTQCGPTSTTWTTTKSSPSVTPDTPTSPQTSPKSEKTT